MSAHLDELAALQTVYAIVPQPVFIIDAQTDRVVDANPAAAAILGLPLRQLLERPWPPLAAALSGVRMRAVASGDLLVAVAEAPTDEASDLSAALRDPLTGLGNRESLRRYGQRRAEASPRSCLSLLFIDLDNFKRINDTWGHLAGDQVLRIMAERLASSLRPGDLVVRFGGDEFVVVVERMCRSRDAERLARRIARSMSAPIRIAGEMQVVSASIGIALTKRRLVPLEDLIAEADRAMYRCKPHACQASLVNEARSKRLEASLA